MVLEIKLNEIKYKKPLNFKFQLVAKEAFLIFCLTWCAKITQI